MMGCMRSYYWAYEIGLRKIESGAKALRIGSAWARAIEARWKAATYEQALEAAFNTGSETLLAQEAATVAGLLAGYYERWSAEDDFPLMEPEKEFNLPLPGTLRWRVAGKIDCIGVHKGVQKVIETKTTGDSVAPDSDFWLRLRFNIQVMQYVLAARGIGYDPVEVIYDVTRKPSIKPKNIDDRDEEGLKIVKELSTGLRAKLKNGSWRQSGGEGFEVKSHVETPDEFRDRLHKDTLERPDFYFARKEVPIISDLLDEFQTQRLALIKLIEVCRSSEKLHRKPESAWPRNVNERSCKFCQYQSFCLQNISPDLKHPPSGFAVGKAHVELTIEDEEESETNV